MRKLSLAIVRETKIGLVSSLLMEEKMFREVRREIFLMSSLMTMPYVQ